MAEEKVVKVWNFNGIFSLGRAQAPSRPTRLENFLELR